MTLTRWLPLALVLGVAAGCASNPKGQLPSAAAEPPPAAAPAPQLPPPQGDSVLELVAASEQYYANGERELKLGHLERARYEFDRALEVLLESPFGGRAEPRVREHFDRLVDRISAHELAALTQGDGFVEKKYEPASIDALLSITTFEPPGPAPAPELTETVEADLQSTSHDIPIPLNERVLLYVELFQGRLRDWIADGLARGAHYLPMIQNVFRAEGLPLDLAYVPIIESAFKPNALSRAKAKGVWQFMRGTALEHGLKQDWYIDERSDPEKATLAAAKYLKSLVTLFDGDWNLALASYNGGPGRVQRAMKRTRLADFWDLASPKKKYLPRETREYVPMILAAIIIGRNPAQYGFEVVAAQPIAYEKVPVPTAIDLRRVAEWTGSTIDDIQSLNPELRRWTTPVRYPNYEVKVPLGTAEKLRERLGATHTSELSALTWHTVRKGESLLSIARKLGVSRSDLAEANHLTIRSRVRPNQDLIIPRAPTTLLASVERRAPAEEVIAASRPVGGVAGTPDVRPSDRVRLIYRVKRGDTLASIARLFRTTVASLRTWNKQLRSSRINPGDRLTVFAVRALPAGE